MNIPNRMIVGIVFRDPIRDEWADRIIWDSSTLAFEVDTYHGIVMTLDSYLLLHPDRKGEAKYLIARCLWSGAPTRM